MEGKLVEFWVNTRLLHAPSMTYYGASETRRGILVHAGLPGEWLLAVMGPGVANLHWVREQAGTAALYVPPHKDLPAHVSDFRTVGAVEVSNDLVRAALEIAKDRERVIEVQESFRDLAKEEMWKQ